MSSSSRLSEEAQAQKAVALCQPGPALKSWLPVRCEVALSGCGITVSMDPPAGASLGGLQVGPTLRMLRSPPGRAWRRAADRPGPAARPRALGGMPLSGAPGARAGPEPRPTEARRRATRSPSRRGGGLLACHSGAGARSAGGTWEMPGRRWPEHARSRFGRTARTPAAHPPASSPAPRRPPPERRRRRQSRPAR